MLFNDNYLCCQQFCFARFFVAQDSCDVTHSLTQASIGGAVANRLRRRTSDQTVLGSNPAVAAALSPCTRLFTPIVPRRSPLTLASISYLAIHVKYILAKKKHTHQSCWCFKKLYLYSLHLLQSISRHTNVIMLNAVKCSLYVVGQFQCRIVQNVALQGWKCDKIAWCAKTNPVTYDFFANPFL